MASSTAAQDRLGKRAADQTLGNKVLPTREEIEDAEASMACATPRGPTSPFRQELTDLFDPKKLYTDLDGQFSLVWARIQAIEDSLRSKDDLERVREERIRELEVMLNEVARNQNKFGVVLSGKEIPERTPREDIVVVATAAVKSKYGIDLDRDQISEGFRQGENTIIVFKSNIIGSSHYKLTRRYGNWNPSPEKVLTVRIRLSAMDLRLQSCVMWVKKEEDLTNVPISDRRVVSFFTAPGGTQRITPGTGNQWTAGRIEQMHKIMSPAERKAYEEYSKEAKKGRKSRPGRGGRGGSGGGQGGGRGGRGRGGLGGRGGYGGGSFAGFSGGNNTAIGVKGAGAMTHEDMDI